VLNRFGDQLGTPGMFESTFRVIEYAEGEPFATAAGLEVTTTRVPHYLVETYGMRVTNGDRTLAYSGDSGPTERLAELARDADLFVCEATLASGDLDDDPRGHLSADEALAVFAASGAQRLLLTHRPGELLPPDGVELAHDGLALTI
jgi:ribonuclease BN (tRNA processing enzyme)